MELTNFLATLASGLLVLALPILITAGIQYIRVTAQQLKSKLNQDQQQNIDRAVSIAVKAAEQMGGINGLIGPQKKEQAIQIAQSFLAQKGIKLDVGQLVNLIEAEVQTQFSKPTTLVDDPETRQALVDSAIQAAVTAAQQSGLTGLVQGFSPEQKTYALQMAMQYLTQSGIKVDPGILGTLVEGQLARLGVGTGMPLAAQPSASAPVQAPSQSPAYPPAVYPGSPPPGSAQPGG